MEHAKSMPEPYNIQRLKKVCVRLKFLHWSWHFSRHTFMHVFFFTFGMCVAHFIGIYTYKVLSPKLGTDSVKIPSSIQNKSVCNRNNRSVEHTQRGVPI